MTNKLRTATVLAILTLPAAGLATAANAAQTPVSAAPTPPPAAPVGQIECCTQSATSNSAQGAKVLAELGIVVQSGVLVGLDCSPISTLAIAGNSCNAQPVVCDDNNWNGLVAIDCAPANVTAATEQRTSRP